MSSHDLVLDLDSHVDFTYALETYLIYPWVRDGDELVRPLRIGPKDAHHAVARIKQSAPSQLTARVTVDDAVPDGIEQVRAALVRCLQLDYPYEQIAALAADDPVLQAAVSHRGLGRGKLYPEVFEALCGVVCAKRTNFNRIYAMMRNLAAAFGEPSGETVAGEPVHVFPTPPMMARATDEELRACKVGFRAKDLANVAGYLTEVGYTWADWRSRPPGEVISDLLGIKGVGPYTANLTANLVYGSGGTPHVDTYVIDVIGRLYLDNPNPSPEAVAAFIDQRWGHLGEHVLDFLTTDTEQWVSTIGKTVGVRSGARS
ncbi:DNA-3-methyladenine glycosylase family protein [Micromonospora fulviviridis]|uniref:DNA-(apurinic or apyrimidinic site) lyase n=1 Tax=Micromonospora fulviviridis TaxID=47860 RepID=A0ABV2VCT0_9ACTN